MPKLVVDGIALEVEDGITVLQACEIAGKEIPHFCFHERLNIAGNCRMCLVEMEKSPKLVASCAMPVSEGIVIHTNTPKVKKAREGVMELLLINHPLDCPICDQGGECDLQDQAFKYGRGGNRFSDNKRSVQDKNMGPLVKTSMTRCIHCTRCIRFATEVAGVPEIGALYRGEHMEVTSYLERTLTSELSGNIIDICPVGALTSKPYAFKARSWELAKTESIDVLDALGSNIRIDSRGMEVMRILPKLNEDINEEWLSDKARFAYDGLKNMRLDRPYVKKQGKLVEASWDEALSHVAKFFKMVDGEKIAAIAGTLTAVEPMFLLKNLLQHFNCFNVDANQYDYKLDTSSRGNYLFNTTITGIERADVCLLIGANPRQSAPVLNARIGKMQRQGALVVARIGEIDDQTYKIQELGNEPNILKLLATGTHEFSEILKNAKYPMIIVGDAVYSRNDGYALLSIIHEIVDKYKLVRQDWNGFNILHNHAGMVGSLDIGFTPGDKGNNVKDILQKAKTGEIRLVYLLGADEIDMQELGEAFVVYQGHHGDAGANRADVILPSAAYTEQDAIYVNLEGRVQLARAAVQPPYQAKFDWVIIQALAEQLGARQAYADLGKIRKQIAEQYPVFANIDQLVTNKVIKFAKKEKLSNNSILKIKSNYYMTDTISRASITMAKCTQALQQYKEIVA
ncbi:NADH-quinone oxidoreductase subunit G [Candidatus Trichorickettsia mobilis]|uniref:NADH-quinone oxidoreductase n=1 Tax=Candidatus Trichorickettsia mobilis TaxID=1346319 RepID=A0ABZ0URI0_9RICK|nr:NADH-quinone oxidoreductase subunit NuoG [Candidatus Trichorickettsia mobilis]WPY00253.1 NADH-quinone oxidoreductase subunit G [Candidatus Trichorickettsia mobilis]